MGLALGVVGLIWFYIRTPSLRSRALLVPLYALVAVELLTLFWRAYPQNACVTNRAYLADQIQNGLALGLVYAAMAVGLTLIFSVQNIVNFAHGQLFMIGGVVTSQLVFRVLFP